MKSAERRSRIALAVDAIVWTLFGLLWQLFPRALNRRLNRASGECGFELDDVTRGFGMTLVLTGVVELLLLNESNSVIRKLAVARVVYTLFLATGFSVYHASEFYRRPGFWGALMSSVVPTVALCMA